MSWKDLRDLAIFLLSRSSVPYLHYLYSIES